MDKMLQSDLDSDTAFVFALPQLVDVKLDRMTVRLDGSKEAAFIYDIELVSNPMEPGARTAQSPCREAA
jgi:allophanate hydrolase subunit 2